jgi:hypothetical protein
MKKIALLVSMALVMGSVACGGDKPAADPSSTSTTAAPTDTSAAAPTTPAAPTDTSAAPAAPATK